MKTAPRILVAFVVAAFFLTPPANAADSPPPPGLAFASTSSRLWAPVEWTMSSQRRMLQVSTVGMCLALWIIMWRK
jgi:hypothetical protein